MLCKSESMVGFIDLLFAKSSFGNFEKRFKYDLPSNVFSFVWRFQFPILPFSSKASNGVFGIGHFLHNVQGGKKYCNGLGFIKQKTKQYIFFKKISSFYHLITIVIE